MPIEITLVLSLIFFEKSEDEWWESEDTSWLLLFSACSGNQPKIQLICQESPNEEMSGKYQMLKFVLDFLKTAKLVFSLISQIRDGVHFFFMYRLFYELTTSGALLSMAEEETDVAFLDNIKRR